jgi:hypothetical protein
MTAAKMWTSTLGPVILAVLRTYTGLPEEACVAIASAAVGLLTYFIPNTPAKTA